MFHVPAIARICHEANRALCLVNGDTSQVPWDEAPEWQRESCINGVQAALADPDATPASQHDNWSAHKIADGWTYGPVKDELAKTHPCLVPFEELPPEHRVKDVLFLSIVRAVAPRDAVTS